MESQLTYTREQWDLVLASFVLATFALLSTFVYLLATRKELSPRYRPSGTTGAVIAMVAGIAYIFLIIAWCSGFDYMRETDTFVPSGSVLQFREAYRYMDWAVTVPLLCLELLVVSTVSGLRAKRTRFVWMSLAFLMIVTGFLGADTFDSPAGMMLWGLVSTAFFVPLYVSLLRTGLRSARELGEPAGPHLRGATLMLSWTWGVYPLAYLVPLLFPGSADWAVARQVAETIADIAAKVGFGFLVHSAAKARTAVDLAEGAQLSSSAHRTGLDRSPVPRTSE